MLNGRNPSFESCFAPPSDEMDIEGKNVLGKKKCVGPTTQYGAGATREGARNGSSYTPCTPNVRVGCFEPIDVLEVTCKWLHDMFRLFWEAGSGALAWDVGLLKNLILFDKISNRHRTQSIISSWNIHFFSWFRNDHKRNTKILAINWFLAFIIMDSQATS